MEEWWRLSHLFATVFLANVPVYLVIPAVTDVTVEAVCGGAEECSLAIYLTGFQLAITGLGSVLMMPIIGNLSDAYGRKKILTIPLSLQIIPLLILAWKRTTNFFIAYYSIKMLTDMIVNGGVVCIAFSYLADNVAERKRVAAFAVLNGFISIAIVCGTFTSGFLSLALIFQVASTFAILALVYMRVFLKDSNQGSDFSEPLISSSESDNFIYKIPSPKHVFRLLTRSPIFALAASVSFFYNVAMAGVDSFLTYFLKVRFHFDKDQFALVFLIANLGATFTIVLLMPLFGPFIGEETLLCIGLFAGFLSMLLDSIAWAAWVPFASASLGLFFTLSSSCVSIYIQHPETSYLNQIQTSFYLDFPGFCILCIGFAYLIGFIMSLVIWIKPFISRENKHQPLC